MKPDFAAEARVLADGFIKGFQRGRMASDLVLPITAALEAAWERGRQECESEHLSPDHVFALRGGEEKP